MSPKTQPRIKIGAALLTVAVILLHLFFTRYAAPIGNYNEVADGMMEVQVRTIMGEPPYIRHYKPDVTAFRYGGLGKLRWCKMEVFFDKDGHVQSKFHDD